MALGAWVGWDFYRVSQLYKPASERPVGLRDDTARKVATTPFFKEQVDFAALTTARVTQTNAAQVFATASALLHFSPEPRVIEPLIDSAVLLGKGDVAAFHITRYRVAYPASYARWSGRTQDGPADGPHKLGGAPDAAKPRNSTTVGR